MRKCDTIGGVTVLAAVLVIAVFTGVLEARQADSPAATKELADQWDNLLHYIRLGRADLASSFGQAIIDSKPDVRELYRLAEQSDKGGGVLARGRALKDLSSIVDDITELISAGAKAVRMDPDEIARWIEMLGGTPRQFLMASKRLAGSGEYAVPQIIDRISDAGTSPILRERLITVLPRLGEEQGVAARVSVTRGLSAALAVRDPAVKEVICRALGSIGYPQAAPYLKELADREDLLDRTRSAAMAALSACAGEISLKKQPAELFYGQALKYYRRNESYNPDPRYDTANVWYWQEGLGLIYKVVPNAIFNDIYAMRCARSALEHDAGFDPAVTLWIAANIRRQVNLPEGAKDPTSWPGRPSAEFTALAGGATYLQRVLALAMDDGDIDVAVAAIESLARTTGATNLVSTVNGGAQPLVEALNYPSRKVRYLAAEALALARPRERFSGWQLVVPVLTEALRASGTPTAVLADPDLARRNKVKDLLRGGGNLVIDDKAFGPALQAARAAGGADLIVLASDIAGPNVAEAVAQLRTEAVFGRIPVIVVARKIDLAAARALSQSDPLVVVLADEQLDGAAMAAATEEAVTKAGGAAALSADESADWSVRAAGAIRLLALTNNPVFDLTEAAKSLIAALGDNRKSVRLAAVEALAHFQAAEAQQAIAELAFDGRVDEGVRVPAYGALSESVRRFGNQLTEKQVQAVIDEVMSNGSQDIRNAAAQAMGALSLPSEKVKELIQSFGRPRL